MKKRLPGLVLMFVLLALLLLATALAADIVGIELNQEYVEDWANRTDAFGGAGVILRGGNTYSLADDLTLDGRFLCIESSSDRSAFDVTLDLNGNTLAITDPVSINDRAFGVKYYSDQNGTTALEQSPIGILVYDTYTDGAASPKLTLKDSSEAKTGKLIIEGQDAEKATGIYVGRNCILNIAGGTLTNSTTVRDGTYTATGVKMVLGTVNMTGGRIENQAFGVELQHVRRRRDRRLRLSGRKRQAAGRRRCARVPWI